MTFDPGPSHPGPAARGNAGCWKWGAIGFFAIGFLIVGGAVGGAALLGLFDPIDVSAIRASPEAGEPPNAAGGANGQAGPTDGEWNVRFVVDEVEYAGRLDVRSGSGTLTLAYQSRFGPMRVRERCSVEGASQVTVRCRDPEVLSGREEYSADSFDLSFVDGGLMRGTVRSEHGATGTATFSRQ